MREDRGRMPTLPAPPDGPNDLPVRIRSRFEARRTDAAHFAQHQRDLERNAEGIEVACMHLHDHLLDALRRELAGGTLAEEVRNVADKARAAAPEPPLEEDVWANAAAAVLHARVNQELMLLRNMARRSRQEALRSNGMLSATEDELAHLAELVQLLDGPSSPVVPSTDDAPVVGPGSGEQAE